MSKDTTKIDKAWRLVFESRDLLSEIRDSGYAIVTAKELKKRSGGAEARLMAYIDYSRNRPQIFKENDLNILPNKHGSYVIFKDSENSCYVKLPERSVFDTPKLYQSPEFSQKFETLQNAICSSESDAVELARISSLLSTFCGAKNLSQTKSGRFRSAKFDIELPDSHNRIEIDGVQLECDRVFEAENLVVIVEAKMGFSEDINVRQLFYPYMHFAKQASKKKKLMPILLAYHMGEYRLTEFRFEHELDQRALVRQEFFLINEDPLREFDLDKILNFLPAPKEPEYPFPQADKLDKVLDTVWAINQGTTGKEELALYFGFNTRQSDYYKNAARYLGLVEEDFVTKLGRTVISESERRKRNELVLKCILSRSVFREAFQLLKRNEFNTSKLTKEDLTEIILRFRIDVKKSTLSRRATTIRQWLKWVVANSGKALGQRK